MNIFGRTRISWNNCNESPVTRSYFVYVRKNSKWGVNILTVFLNICFYSLFQISGIIPQGYPIIAIRTFHKV